MKEYQSLSHTRWDCKHHIVFKPRRRKRKMFGVLRRHLGEIFHELALHKKSKIVEGHMMGDHVHMCLNMLSKYAISNVGIFKREECDPRCTEVRNIVRLCFSSRCQKLSIVVSSGSASIMSRKHSRDRQRWLREVWQVG